MPRVEEYVDIGSEELLGPFFDDHGRVPTIWIAGSNIAYHEPSRYWAEVIHTRTGPT